VPFTPSFADLAINPVWALRLSDHNQIAWGVLIGLGILILAEIGAGLWMMHSGDPMRIRR
jgi:hypothetical protein